MELGLKQMGIGILIGTPPKVVDVNSQDDVHYGPPIQNQIHVALLFFSTSRLCTFRSSRFPCHHVFLHWQNETSDEGVFLGVPLSIVKGIRIIGADGLLEIESSPTPRSFTHAQGEGDSPCRSFDAKREKSRIKGCALHKMGMRFFEGTFFAWFQRETKRKAAV